MKRETINRSELARILGLIPETFRKKLHKIDGCNFSNSEVIAIEFILKDEFEIFIKSLKNQKNEK